MDCNIDIFIFIGDEGNWKWAHSNDLLLTDKHWGYRRPNNKTANHDDCAVMVLGGLKTNNNDDDDFQWEDHGCLVHHVQQQFVVAPICQQDNVATSIANTTAVNCLAGWTAFAVHCYLPKTTKRSWLEAEADCMIYPGGHLASIHSEAETSFVTQFLTGNFWLGGKGNRQQQQDNWTWSDGSTWDFAQWNSFEDYYGRMLCVISQGLGWSGASCDAKYPYICKI